MSFRRIFAVLISVRGTGFPGIMEETQEFRFSSTIFHFLVPFKPLIFKRFLKNNDISDIKGHLAQDFSHLFFHPMKPPSSPFKYPVVLLNMA